MRLNTIIITSTIFLSSLSYGAAGGQAYSEQGTSRLSSSNSNVGQRTGSTNQVSFVLNSFFDEVKEYVLSQQAPSHTKGLPAREAIGAACRQMALMVLRGPDIPSFIDNRMCSDEEALNTIEYEATRHIQISTINSVEDRLKGIAAGLYNGGEYRGYAVVAPEKREEFWFYGLMGVKGDSLSVPLSMQEIKILEEELTIAQAKACIKTLIKEDEEIRKSGKDGRELVDSRLSRIRSFKQPTVTQDSQTREEA